MPADSPPIPARGSRLLPNLLFFPAAALYAALALPWSVLSMTGVVAGPAALSTGFGHAHEMLLGYALAVVAGNQLSPMLLAALMLFMGGRVIAPAAAGQRYRQGQSLAARVQPRIEGWLMVAMTVAVVAAVIPRLEVLMRLACAGAGALALVRLLRWRLWACKGRPDLMSLGAGYGWLVLGLSAIAISSSGADRTAAMHVVTVGALGTLTFNVMGATILRRVRRDPADEPLLAWGTALISIAAVSRVAAALAPAHRVELLVAAAACWAGAFLVLSWLIAASLLTRTVKRGSTPDA